MGRFRKDRKEKECGKFKISFTQFSGGHFNKRRILNKV
jgi:hypothetical protein